MISINMQKFFTDNYSGDKIKKNKVDRACSTYGEEYSCLSVFWRGNLRERYHLENSGLDGGRVLK
jgi:hypothetical protein